MTDLGTDIACVDDLDPALTCVEGRLALAQALVRRLTTRRGALRYDTSYGIDVRDEIHETQAPGFSPRLAARVAAECRQDERVESVRVRVAADSTESSVAITLDVVDADGPFRLVLGVSSVSVELLQGP